MRSVLDQTLPREAKAGLYELLADAMGVGAGVREPSADYLVRRALTEQDRTIYALCRPERLLRMALAFTVFDGGRRKIARYQQFFAVERIVGRVKQRDETGRRAGGIVWHTQGCLLYTSRCV